MNLEPYTLIATHDNGRIDRQVFPADWGKVKMIGIFNASVLAYAFEGHYQSVILMCGEEMIKGYDFDQARYL